MAWNIVLWGYDPVVSWFGHVPYYMKLAKERGCKIIAIDPCHNLSAELMADQWILSNNYVNNQHFAAKRMHGFANLEFDQKLCQGCRSCYEACPYGAPKFASDEPGTKMSKCTMCVDHLVKGDMPVCANACPMRTLDFGPIEDLVEKYGGCQQLESMPSPNITHVNWVAKPHDPKQKLVRLDEKKAIELSKKTWRHGRRLFRCRKPSEPARRHDQAQ